MDLMQLAQSVVAIILPLVPRLLGKAADKAAESVGAELGKVALGRASEVWTRLVQSDHDGKLIDSANEVAASPNDPDAEAALRLRIRRLLEQDEALRADLAVMAPAAASGNTAIASGDAAVAIGGAANQAFITTSAAPIRK